jgi:hypothetical protein
MTLDVGKGQFRVEAKLRSDGLQDVPPGCKISLGNSGRFRDLISFTVLTTARLSHQMSVGGSGL